MGKTSSEDSTNVSRGALIQADVILSKGFSRSREEGKEIGFRRAEKSGELCNEDAEEEVAEDGLDVERLLEDPLII